MRDSWHGVVSSTFFLSFSFSSSFSFLPPFLLRQLVTHQTTAALALSTRPSRSLPPAPCLSSVIWSAVFYWPVFCCAAGQSGGLVRGNWWMAHPELYKASSSPLHWCVDAAQLAAQWVRVLLWVCKQTDAHGRSALKRTFNLLYSPSPSDCFSCGLSVLLCPPSPSLCYSSCVACNMESVWRSQRRSLKATGSYHE